MIGAFMIRALKETLLHMIIPINQYFKASYKLTFIKTGVIIEVSHFVQPELMNKQLYFLLWWYKPTS